MRVRSFAKIGDSSMNVGLSCVRIPVILQGINAFINESLPEAGRPKNINLHHRHISSQPKNREA